MLKISFNRNNPLTFKSISQLQQQEAQDILSKFNKLPENRRNIEENYVIQNGILVKEDNQNTISAFEAKIKKQYTLNLNNNYKPTNLQIDSNVRNPLSIKYKGLQGLQLAKQIARQNNNFSQDEQELLQKFLQKDHTQHQLLKNDYCRLWYQKLALEAAFNSVIHENNRKDEIIKQLIQQQELKGNGLPQLPFNQQNFNTQPNPLNYKNVHPHIVIQPTLINQIPNQTQNRSFINANMRNNF